MIGDRGERLSRALDELYAEYELTEPMFSNVLRDAELVDAAAASGLTTATALDPSGCGVPRPYGLPANVISQISASVIRREK